MKTLSWKPVRRGAIYCAPACGASCTWAEYQTALEKAKALSKMLGAGWKPIVFENMGWHFKANKGECSVRQYGATGYNAFLDAEGGQFIGRGKTALSAYGHALRQMREHINSLEKSYRKAIA